MSFDTAQGEVQAVRDVSLTLASGEVLAIVGESGCGKSALLRCIMKLLPDTARIKHGTIAIDGTDITRYHEKDMQKLRGKIFSMVFQDPMTSLNPTITIGKQIAEAVLIHHPKMPAADVYRRVIELMDLVGIKDPAVQYKCYPHQFSGGMRQRSVLAIALASDPKILLADEPTTSLDVTIQAQILDLMREIQKKLGTAMILVSHDLGVVARIADRAAVMYAGKIVETGTVEEIFYDPRHPYTWGLLAALPFYSKDGEALQAIPGTPPTLIDPPPGDAFACRSRYAMAIDYEQAPPMFPVTDTHAAATWLLDPRAPKFSQNAHTNLPSDIQLPDAHTPKTSWQDICSRDGHSHAAAADTSHMADRQYTPHAPSAAGTLRHDLPMQDTSHAADTASGSADSDCVLEHSFYHNTALNGTGFDDKASNDTLLHVSKLSHHFCLSKNITIHALDNVSFDIKRGEIFGLVGESGCGKSTIARCIMNIYQPAGGTIYYNGINICDPKARRAHRRMLQAERQIIFQDSASSLNPRMKAADIITEPMAIHRRKPKRGSYLAEAAFQLHYVGLDASYLYKYPSELSGGMRQRVAIARALSMEPQLLVADEPIASLDVSIQAQIINLFKHLHAEHGFSFLFIAHDLSVVKYLCSRIGVMYRGRIVEIAPAGELFAQPLHPYTKSLLSAIPVPDPLLERNRKMHALYEQDFECGGTLCEVSPDHWVLSSSCM